MLIGMVVQAKANSGVFRELCPVSFLEVGKSSSVLLYYVVMLYVNCGDDG